MKSKLLVLLASLSALFISMTYAQDNGELLFKAKCASCHVSTRPADISKLVAPPTMGVVRHVKMNYANKKDAVAFIVEYTLHPNKEKAVCESDKIKHFGLMPSQKGNVSEKELKVIASWMYDNFANWKKSKCKSGNCQGGNCQGNQKKKQAQKDSCQGE